MLQNNNVYHGDCLEIMQDIDDNTIDMIICDLPYGVTARNKWDIVIPTDLLWEQYNRIIKDDGAIVLTATQPFSSMMVMSNPDMFRYEWVWQKNKSTGFLNAKKIPLKNHETVLIFYKKPPVYNPQKTFGHKPVNSFTKHTSDGTNYGETKTNISGGGQTDRYPTTIQKFNVVNNDNSGGDKHHPTQKPVEMFEYFIKTYTNEGDLVLDNCAGSGTTGIACVNTNRDYILIEQDIDYYNICLDRLNGV